MLFVVPVVLAFLVRVTWFLVQDVIYPDYTRTLPPAYYYVRRIVAAPVRQVPVNLEYCTNVFSPEYIFAHGLPPDRPLTNSQHVMTLYRNFTTEYPNGLIWLGLLLYSFILVTCVVFGHFYWRTPQSCTVDRVQQDPSIFALMHGTAPQLPVTTINSDKNHDRVTPVRNIQASARGDIEFIVLQQLATITDFVNNVAVHADTSADLQRKLTRMETSMNNYRHRFGQEKDALATVCHNHDQKHKEHTKRIEVLEHEVELHEKAISQLKETKIMLNDELEFDQQKKDKRDCVALSDQFESQKHPHQQATTQEEKAQDITKLAHENVLAMHETTYINQEHQQHAVEADTESLDLAEVGTQRNLLAQAEHKLETQKSLYEARIEQLENSMALSKSEQKHAQESSDAHIHQLIQKCTGLEKMVKESDALRQDMENLNDKLFHVEKELRSSVTALSEREKTIEELRSNEKDLNETIAKATSKEQELWRQLKAAKESKASIDAEFKCYQGATANTMQKLTEAIHEKETVEREAAAAYADVQKWQRTMDQIIANVNIEKTTLEHQLSEQMIENRELEKKIAKLESERQSELSMKQSTTEQFAQQKVLEELKARNDELEKSIQEIKSQSSGTSEKSSTSKEQKETKSLLESATRDARELQLKLDESTLEKNGLEKRIRELEAEINDPDMSYKQDYIDRVLENGRAEKHLLEMKVGESNFKNYKLEKVIEQMQAELDEYRQANKPAQPKSEQDVSRVCSGPTDDMPDRTVEDQQVNSQSSVSSRPVDPVPQVNGPALSDAGNSAILDEQSATSPSAEPQSVIAPTATPTPEISVPEPSDTTKQPTVALSEQQEVETKVDTQDPAAKTHTESADPKKSVKLSKWASPPNGDPPPAAARPNTAVPNAVAQSKWAQAPPPAEPHYKRNASDNHHQSHSRGRGRGRGRGQGTSPPGRARRRDQ